MPVKTEDEASGVKTAVPAESSGKKEGEAAHASAAANTHAATPGLDAAFKALIASLLRQQLNLILPELRELKAATVANTAAATSSNAVISLPPSSVAAALGEIASSAGGNDDLLRSIKSQLDKLEQHLASISSGNGESREVAKSTDDSASGQAGLGRQVVEPITQFMGKELHALAKYVADFRQTLDARMGRLEESVGRGAAVAPASVIPVAAPVKPQPQAQYFAPVEADDDEWKEAILGDELCRDPSLSEARTRLFRGVLAADSGAKALAGQMMLAQAATVDRFPPLMKEVGEAYYRWRPKTAGVSDPFETALAAWLKRRCDAEGLGNTIELVIVGDRFDATRHNASERGAEITAVHGWVVLRDNGKVYTKANVSVK